MWAHQNGDQPTGCKDWWFFSGVTPGISWDFLGTSNHRQHPYAQPAFYCMGILYPGTVSKDSPIAQRDKVLRQLALVIGLGVGHHPSLIFVVLGWIAYILLCDSRTVVDTWPMVQNHCHCVVCLGYSTALSANTGSAAQCLS